MFSLLQLAKVDCVIIGQGFHVRIAGTRNLICIMSHVDNASWSSRTQILFASYLEEQRQHCRQQSEDAGMMEKNCRCTVCQNFLSSPRDVIACRDLLIRCCLHLVPASSWAELLCWLNYLLTYWLISFFCNTANISFPMFAKERGTCIWFFKFPLENLILKLEADHEREENRKKMSWWDIEWWVTKKIRKKKTLSVN